VLDAYTGEEREVNSLSGGETFQASLALALGVADTVQAHAGGMQLDALFIDEGFGSLDPDNLQLAMDELDRLRAGGRLIGVISHVAALRERIRAGISVSSGSRGSSVSLSGTQASAA
jgi:exonuclease SbcC